MKILAFPVGLLALLVGLSLAQAGDKHEIEKELLQSGQIVSIDTLLKKVQSEFSGHILKIKLDDEDDAKSGWVYETKILREDGVVIEIEYDAKTLEIVKIEEGKKRDRH